MTEIPKAYEPQAVEEQWYDFWLKHGCFTADPARVTPRRPAYAIVIPPPNVTGMLHMGHVLNNTIQDILARKARMDGKEVLWLPGTDHAGIATQVQVEKALKKEERKSKHDLGREAFLNRVWAWKEKHGGIIINQLKKLGCSCDWTRERFTMDPDYSRCVQRVFVDLYNKGLIYRGKRMVNWCPVSQTALSDEEVEMKPQKGFLYHFRVEVAESLPGGSPGNEAPATQSEIRNPKSEIAQSLLTSAPPAETTGGPEIDAAGRVWLTIATTRPETIPGDTAVAVNPKDPRYAHLIGKHVIRPLPIQLPPHQKLIPIIADEHVDFAFGTGVLKVTPAHDKADFEIGQRHHLPLVDIMNPNGTMNELAGESLAGLDRFEARSIAVERLKELGALSAEKPYENNVGFSQRADVPIEPRLSEQWFLKYPSVPASQACVAEGQMKFHPDRWAKVYDHWLTNLQDWCISRQLWWGHRIPVWYRKSAVHGPQSEIWCDLTPPPDPENWEQDPDVLDTWFSSWLWPFATMGWTGDKSPDSQNPTLQAFYPTTDLVTGPDIIFFWVARMIMAGYEFMGDLPFRNVYFTGIIRDKQGRKMSKTLGNSPDPLELIAKYGADALRFGTMRSAPLGQDVLFDEKDVELGRNFCNKLWNACRFRQMQAGEIQGEIRPELLSADDRWILLQLNRAITEITAALESYNFSTATQTIYRFFWSEYCDWYVEASKAALGGTEGTTGNAERQANTLAVIDFVLSHLLRLFHPFLPFVTEELWHGMGYSTDMPHDQGGQTIMNAPWPKPFEPELLANWGLDDSQLALAERRYDLVREGRNLRRQANLPANKKVRFVFKPAPEITPNDVEVMRLLLNAEALEPVRDYAPSKQTLRALTPAGELFLPLEGLVDVDAEKARLSKELARIDQEIDKVRQKLANPNFTQKVPPQVLEEHRQRLADWQEKQAHTRTALEALG
jgi:valyl-tRNA synthetase